VGSSILSSSWVIICTLLTVIIVHVYNNQPAGFFSLLNVLSRFIRADIYIFLFIIIQYHIAAHIIREPSTARAFYILFFKPTVRRGPCVGFASFGNIDLFRPRNILSDALRCRRSVQVQTPRFHSCP